MMKQVAPVAENRTGHPTAARARGKRMKNKGRNQERVIGAFWMFCAPRHGHNPKTKASPNSWAYYQQPGPKFQAVFGNREPGRERARVANLSRSSLNFFPGLIIFTGTR